MLDLSKGIGAQNTRLLRYRFHHPDQLPRHLHQIDGRALFFFRDPMNPMTAGNRVVLDIGFEITDEQHVLRGSVLSGEGDPLEGYWLEFPAQRLIRRLREGRPSARRQRRIPVDVMVEILRHGRANTVGWLLDISVTGARIARIENIGLPGDPFEMKLFAARGTWPNETVRATIAWVEEKEAGIVFQRDDATTRAWTAKLTRAAQAQWSSAREMLHPPMCCAEGKSLDPAVPHAVWRAIMEGGEGGDRTG